MAITSSAPEADERVLSTLNRDGTRRWIRPKLSTGRYHRRRLVTAWALIATFTLIPILRMNGKPLMLFDIPKREFTFFGATFLPTDTFLLMLLLFSIFIGIFLITAFASLGLPGLAGFWAEFFVFRGAFQIMPWFAAIGVIGIWFIKNTPYFLVKSLNR